MSLGNTYNNNKGNSNEPTVRVYSGYRMNNPDSTIDATCITFRFWKTNLCIGIFPRKNTGNDEVSFDMDNGITIYISHTKARILKNELELFMKDPIKYNCVGVPTSSGVITISNGAEYGKDNPVITIRKVSDSGEVVSSFAYEFKRNYHYSVRNYDGKNFDKVYDDYQNLEIEQFVTLLDEYCKAVTNAVAFTVLEQNKYTATRVENKIDSIASSLGVETARNNNSGRKFRNSSYFDSADGRSSSGSSSGTSYTTATIDDLE